MKESFLSFVRHSVVAGVTWLAAKGYIGEDGTAELVAGIMVLVGAGFSWLERYVAAQK